jgi:hypothetical protein
MYYKGSLLQDMALLLQLLRNDETISLLFFIEERDCKDSFHSLSGLVLPCHRLRQCNYVVLKIEVFL